MMWSDFVAQFGNNPYRRVLIGGLREAALALKQAGCRRLWVDGSFVTTKAIPGDFDVCWDDNGVDVVHLQLVAPVLLDFKNGRAAQKAKYRGELFPARNSAIMGSTMTFFEFFQVDKTTGKQKGVVVIDLESLG